jgi:hypothetical protein
MFDYFANERKLNNLIWVLGYDSSPSENYNPGKEYYDIIGGDTYDRNSPYASIYRDCREIHGDTVPVCMHECGTLPDPDACEGEGVMWFWWMLWHTQHLSGHNSTALESIYNHDLVLTRDELPDIMDFLDYSSVRPPVMADRVRPAVVIDNRVVKTKNISGRYRVNIFDLTGARVLRDQSSGPSAFSIASTAAKGYFIVNISNPDGVILNERILYH